MYNDVVSIALPEGKLDLVEDVDDQHGEIQDQMGASEIYRSVDVMSFCPAPLSEGLPWDGPFQDDFQAPSKSLGPLSLSRGDKAVWEGHSSDFGPTSTFGLEDISFGFSQAAKALKPCPEYFEKYTSFISHSPAATILQDLNSLLDNDSNCDHELIASKNKVRGLVRCEGGRANFVVKVFQFSPDEVLIEFHRRHGCAVVFNQLFRRSVEGLAAHFVRNATSPAGSIESFVDCAPALSPLPLSLFGESPINSAAAEESVDTTHLPGLWQRLAQDATCEFLDVQREAVAALACIAGEHCTLPCQEAVEVCVACLTSQDEVVQENACKLLVSICARESLRNDIVKQCLSSLITVLDLPGSLENRATKRYIAQAFVVLTSRPEHAHLMKERMAATADAQHMATLRKYAQYHDSALQQNITTALNQIETA